MSGFHAYEYEVRNRARALRREAEADRRAYEVRAHLRERRRAAVLTMARRIVRPFRRLAGYRQFSHIRSNA